MMNSKLLEVQGLSKRFDGVIALSEFSCNVKKTEIVGLIGPNGAGKTTLFNVLTGLLPLDVGQMSFNGTELNKLPPHKFATLGIARTFQNLRLIRQMTVLDNVLLCFGNQGGEHLCNMFLKWKNSKLQEKKNKERALYLLHEAGIDGKTYELADSLSYGQQKLLSIVCCLATGAELLLFDEPIAGIAPQMIEKLLLLIQGLPALGKSVIFIEHNMDAVMEISDRVIFMDTGRKIREGAPEKVRNDPMVIEAYIN